MDCEKLRAICRAEECQNLEFLVRDDSLHLGNLTAAHGPQAVCDCLAGSGTSVYLSKHLLVHQHLFTTWFFFLDLFF